MCGASVTVTAASSPPFAVVMVRNGSRVLCAVAPLLVWVKGTIAASTAAYSGCAVAVRSGSCGSNARAARVLVKAVPTINGDFALTT